MRISGIENYLGGADNVHAISIIRGEQINYIGTVVDSDNAAIDITNFTNSAVAEFYEATVSVTNKGKDVAITNLIAATPAIADVTLSTTRIQSGSGSGITNRGQFRLVIPANLATDAQTAAADANNNVLIAAIYVTHNDGATNPTIRKNRILVIIRHSA